MWLGLGLGPEPNPGGVPRARSAPVQRELSLGLMPLVGPDSATLGVLTGGHLFPSVRCTWC